MKKLPVLVIVGRPNVGKSTLFNRISGKKMSVVHDLPGVTRDRIYIECSLLGKRFYLVDTGGFETQIAHDDQMLRKVVEQTCAAIEEASMIMFVMDIKTGLLPIDIEISLIVQKTGKPVIYVLNKADSPCDELSVSEFYSLGVERFFTVSAHHKQGLYELEEAIAEVLPQHESPFMIDAEPTRIAIIGRPNVGKSSMVNAFLGSERVVVTDIPGTTRDPVDSEIKYYGKRFVLVDTAGIRKRGKIAKNVELDCVIKANESLERSHVAAIVIDGKEGVTEQDAHIAGIAVKSGRGCIIVVNKWDAVEKDSGTANKYEGIIRHEMKFLEFVPIIFVSAATRQRLFSILETAETIRGNWERHVETSVLNKALEKWLVAHSPPMFKTRQTKIYYISQLRSAPPTFVLFVNYPQGLHFSYKRYLVNKIRKTFGFDGCPVSLLVRKKR